MNRVINKTKVAHQYYTSDFIHSFMSRFSSEKTLNITANLLPDFIAIYYNLKRILIKYT